MRVDVWPDGRELSVTEPVARELLLTEAEGLVKLSYHEPLIVDGVLLRPAGLYFDRTMKSIGSGPRLFIFPPPYHPVEVMMANRSWGGEYLEAFSLEAYGEIGRFRHSEFPVAISVAAAWLHKTRDEVVDLYHLFTPFNWPDNDPWYIRDALWEGLGFSVEQEEDALIGLRKNDRTRSFTVAETTKLTQLLRRIDGV